jgi:hypothetical protein
LCSEGGERREDFYGLLRILFLQIGFKLFTAQKSHLFLIKMKREMSEKEIAAIIEMKMALVTAEKIKNNRDSLAKQWLLFTNSATLHVRVK